MKAAAIVATPSTSGTCGQCVHLASRQPVLAVWPTAPRRASAIRLQAAKGTESTVDNDPDNTTRKFGLEAGLFQALTTKPGDGSKPRTATAKELLARYGGAYLLTSISFALVSFAACYAAVSAGVDVGGLLARVGLQVTDTNERVGTFAIAYAAHKALSPVRFPPTVALTPIVARMFFGNKSTADEQQNEQQ